MTSDVTPREEWAVYFLCKLGSTTRDVMHVIPLEKARQNVAGFLPGKINENDTPGTARQSLLVILSIRCCPYNLTHLRMHD